MALTETESLVVDFLLKDEGQSWIKGIASAKTLNERLVLVTKAIGDLTIKYSALALTATEAANAMNFVNKANMVANKMGADPKQSVLGMELGMISDEVSARTLLRKQIDDVIVARKAELAVIKEMKPADKIPALANIVNQETQNGVKNVTGLVKALGAETNTLPPTLQKVTKAAENAKNGFWKMAQEAFGAAQIMQMVFGVLTAMVVFTAIQKLGELFTMVLQQAKDLQNAVSNLANAEKIMSQSGIEVSGQKLLDIIKELESRWVNISHVDLMKATGDVALKMADQGVSVKELQTLLDSSLAMQVLNPDKNLATISDTVTSAVLSGKTQGIRNLGYGDVNTQVIAQKALELGYTKKITDALTNQQRVHATIAVIQDENLKKLEGIVKMQDNLANASNRLSTNWKNLMGDSGSGPVAYWNAFLSILADAFDTISKLGKIVSYYWEQVGKTFDGIATRLGPLGTFIKWMTSNLEAIIKSLTFGPVGVIVKAMQEKIDKNAANNPPLSTQNEPTGPLLDESAGTAEDNSKKISSAISNISDAMDSFGDKARTTEEDFSISMTKMGDAAKLTEDRFMEDWLTDKVKLFSDRNTAIAQKNEDFQRSQAQRLADFNQSQQQARQDDQKKQIDSYAKYLDDLRKLRENYLMSLEDALHERDARAVLKLAREYAMNKNNLTVDYQSNKAQTAADYAQQQKDAKANFDLQQAQAAQNHAADLARIKQETAAKVALLDKENQLKLDRMRQDEAIKVAEAAAAHDLEMVRLEAEKQDKLHQLAVSLAEQLGLGENGALAIEKMLNAYFGPGGSMGDIMSWSYANVTTLAQAMADQISAIVSGAAATAASISSLMSITGSNSFSANENVAGYQSTYSAPTGPGPMPRETPRYGYVWKVVNGTWHQVRAYASGGLAIANKPTSAVFGDSPGGEAALFMPLNKLSTLFGAANGGGGSFGGQGGGKMELMVTLSPDLETRIVNKSLDNVSNAIMQVRRARA